MKVTFNQVTEEGLEQLRIWRNSDKVSKFMYSKEPVTNEQQLKWYNGLAEDSSRIYFVCSVNDVAVGCLYFTDINSSSCSWGCYVGEPDAWVGTGMVMEAAALNFVFDFLLLESLNAEVIATNKPPQRMHKMFGYELVDELTVIRYKHEFLVKLFKYNRDSWLINRHKVLSKLPKPIREAAESIQFIDNAGQAFYKTNV